MEEIIEQKISIVEKHPGKKIPLSFVKKITGIKQTTLKSKIRSKEISSDFDGYRYYLTKEQAIEIIKCHRPALLGWTKKRDIIKKHNVKHQTVFNIMCRHKIYHEFDACGYIRFPPESEHKIDELIKEYLAKNVFSKDGKTYYSIVYLAETMAKNIVSDKDPLFERHKERIYKCLYMWISKGEIPSIKKNGFVTVYVPDYVYNDLSTKLRIKDTSILANTTTRTIYNWIDDGKIKPEKVVGNFSMVDVKNLDDVLLNRLQNELTKVFRKDQNTINQIGDIGSSFWRGIIKNSKQASVLFDKIEIDIGRQRAIKEVARKRKNSYLEISIDKPVSKDNEAKDSATFHDILSNEKSEFDEETFQCLGSAINRLNEEDKNLICDVFGIGKESGSVPVHILAKQKNMDLGDMQEKINKVLNMLKENYEEISI